AGARAAAAEEPAEPARAADGPAAEGGAVTTPRHAARVLAAVGSPGRPPGLPADEPAVRHYQAARKAPESLAPVYAQLAPGQDAFPEEKDAAEIAARLDELSGFLRQGRWKEAVESLAAPGFRGARLLPAT